MVTAFSLLIIILKIRLMIIIQKSGGNHEGGTVAITGISIQIMITVFRVTRYKV